MSDLGKKQLVTFFFNLRNNIYFHHLTTLKYARHVATDSFVDELDGIIDKFLEIYFGKYGRPNDKNGEYTSFVLNKFNDEGDIFKLLENVKQYVLIEIPKLINKNDTDLYNLRDELLGLLEKLKYLAYLN